jgi:hypothetical protein
MTRCAQLHSGQGLFITSPRTPKRGPCGVGCALVDREPGDISTIEDAGSVEEVRAAWQELRAEV